MGDYIVRAMAANQQIRAFAITSKEMVEFARAAHNTSPVATAALGRLLSAGAMMGVMMKGDKDILTLQMKGTGPLRGNTVTADSKGNVKGYVDNPEAMLPPNAQGKLDVGGAIGVGVLNVIKDMGLKEPYNGTCELKTGEIGDDLTYYFAVSEQVPSAVGLGVLMNKDNTVKRAGGFIIQLMPFIPDEIVDKLAAESGVKFSYNFLPQLIYEKIKEGLDVDKEREQIHKYIEQETSRQEAEREKASAEADSQPNNSFLLSAELRILFIISRSSLLAQVPGTGG